MTTLQLTRPERAVIQRHAEVYGVNPPDGISKQTWSDLRLGVLEEVPEDVYAALCDAFGHPFAEDMRIVRQRGLADALAAR